jgi:hypothetical protein
LPVLAVALGCSGSTPTGVDQTLATLSASVPNVPQTVSELSGSATLKRITDNGPYLGFDTSDYPGDAVMQSWRANTDYDWVGFYLPAPCHKDASWASKRDTIEAMGWGVAVVYVGQQTWGRTARSTKRTPAGASCAASLVSAAQGRVDGDDAIARAAAEGFANGTAVFLDLEHMDVVPNAMRDYYVAWTERVLDDGRYRPAYYAHTQNAPLVYGDVRAVFDARGIDADPPFWIAGGSNFGRDRDPQDVGHAFAAAWQGVLDTWEKHAAIRLPIDVSVASLPSPSAAD